MSRYAGLGEATPLALKWPTMPHIVARSRRLEITDRYRITTVFRMIASTPVLSPDARTVQRICM